MYIYTNTLIHGTSIHIDIKIRVQQMIYIVDWKMANKSPHFFLGLLIDIVHFHKYPL